MQESKNLHFCLMIILEEIKRICEKNEINYFLIGGTLLGAVRNGGIIPWDDDVDVGILREEYERFIQACKSDLSNKFIMCEPYSELKYGLNYAKIKLVGTRFPEETLPVGLSDEIFVDVFPIDKMPKNQIVETFQKQSMKLLKHALLFKCGYKLTYGSKFIVLLLTLLSFLPKTLLLDSLTLIQTFANHFGESDYYLNQNSSYEYGKEIFPKDTIEKGLDFIIFEEDFFPIPSSPDLVLQKLYGAYKTLPPKDKQIFRHLSGEIDYGEYAFE